MVLAGAGGSGADCSSSKCEEKRACKTASARRGRARFTAACNSSSGGERGRGKKQMCVSSAGNFFIRCCRGTTEGGHLDIIGEYFRRERKCAIGTPVRSKYIFYRANKEIYIFRLFVPGRGRYTRRFINSGGGGEV